MGQANDFASTLWMIKTWERSGQYDTIAAITEAWRVIKAYAIFEESLKSSIVRIPCNS